MSVRREERGQLKELRPGLDRFTVDASVDTLDSGLASMPSLKESEVPGRNVDGQTTLSQERSSDNSGSAQQRFPKLRDGLEKFNDLTLNDSVDDGYASVPKGVETTNGNVGEPQTTAEGSGSTSQRSERGVSIPPKLQHGRNALTATSLWLGPALETVRIDGEEKEFFLENTNCHNYACTSDARYLLAPYRLLLASPNEDGDTTLHLAVIYHQPQVITQILSVFPDSAFINQQNNLGQTALHLAVVTNQPTLVRHLVQQGADLRKVDHHGNTPIHLAAQYGMKDCISALIGNKYSRTLSSLCLSQRNFDGFTALHIAVLQSQLDIAKMLVSGGADIDDQDMTCGRTALHHAVETDQLALASSILFEHQADVDARTFDGNVPLHTAAGRNMVAMVGLLVAVGADRNVRNNEGDRPSDLTDNTQVLQVLSLEQ